MINGIARWLRVGIWLFGFFFVHILELIAYLASVPSRMLRAVNVRLFCVLDKFSN